MTRLAACAAGFPGGEGVAEFGGAAMVDLGGADGAQPDVAAGLQPAVVGGAVLDPDLDLVADGDGAAVALPHRRVRVGGGEGPQVHPSRRGAIRRDRRRPPGGGSKLCVYTETVRSREPKQEEMWGRMIGGLLRFAPGRLGAR